MPFIKLQFRPGINRDQTDYSGEGGWYESEKVRFRSGYPQKLGGWAQATTNTFVGVCRQMWAWITTYADDFLSLGTEKKVYIEAGGIYYDITPLRTTTPTLSNPNTNNCVYTVSGSLKLVITLGTAHNALTGSYVTITGVTGVVGGVPNAQVNGNHLITVTSATSFYFPVTTAAASTVAGGGGVAITIDFEIEPGNAIATAGYGWGVGTWGRDTWGLGATTGAIYLPQEDWWFNNLDNDLIMNIRNGAPYYWARGTAADPSAALATRAITLQAVATAGGFDPNAVPVKVMQTLVSQQDKHVLAFGAVPLGSTSTADFDPLLIRWSDQDEPGQWYPAVTNSSGFLKVSRGSRIVCAVPTRQETLVWTDTHLYTLQFTGTTDVFSLQEYADNISIISPRAAISAANITYWMGQDKFYAYTGRIETLACTLRNHVFENLNYNQANQVVCGTNEQWNEVWWMYPSEDSNYNNKYVIYNYADKIWYYGTIGRTAWLDTPLRLYPQAMNTTQSSTTATITGSIATTTLTVTAVTGTIQVGMVLTGNGLSTGTYTDTYVIGQITGTTGSTGTYEISPSQTVLATTITGSIGAPGYLYNHEYGINDDTVAMDSYIQSNDFDIEDGEQFMLTRRLIPDLDFAGSTAAEPEATLTIRPRNFPGSAFTGGASDSQPVIETSVGVYTGQVFVRARGRQLALKVSSADLGVQWQLGAVRLDARPDGKR
jgi:hypothetical protein